MKQSAPGKITKKSEKYKLKHHYEENVKNHLCHYKPMYSYHWPCNRYRSTLNWQIQIWLKLFELWTYIQAGLFKQKKMKKENELLL